MRAARNHSAVAKSPTSGLTETIRLAHPGVSLRHPYHRTARKAGKHGVVFNHTLSVAAGPDMERNPETAPPRSQPAPDGVSSD